MSKNNLSLRVGAMREGRLSISISTDELEDNFTVVIYSQVAVAEIKSGKAAEPDTIRGNSAVAYRDLIHAAVRAF